MNLSAERRRDLVALLAYLFLSLLLTYPLILKFTTHVAGDGSDDPALAWNLWWVRHAIFELGRSPIYTDYLFFPVGLNLAFYTLTYLNAFVSIPIQFVFGIIPAANLNLWLSFTLSGFGAYLLVKYLLRNESASFARFVPVASFASGLLFAFSSNKFLYTSLGQFNIASSQWIPFYILFLFKTFDPPRPSLRNGFLLGLFLLFQALSEFIFASFLILFTLAYLVYWLIAQRFRIRNPSHRDSFGSQSAIRNLTIAAITFLLPMSPILAALISDTLTEGDFLQSGLGFSNIFSGDLIGFFIPSHLHPLFGGLEAQFHFSYINFVFVGYLALALAALALLRVPRARIWGTFAALIFLITLGPTLRVNSQEFSAPFLPFNWLLQLPFIKGNRYPSRWSVMLALCLAVLVGYGMMWLLKRVASHQSPPEPSSRIASNSLLRRPSSVALVSLALCLLLLFEHLSLPLPTSNLQVPEIYRTIARDPGDFTVMELPLAWRNGFRVTGSYRADSQAPIDRSFMLAQWYQTAQQHPILNGNTSRNPENKFQYFSETPVLNSIIAIQAGHSIDDATRTRDKELAPRVLQFFNTRYVIWHTPYEEVNRDVAEKTRAYVEEIFPITKINESYENGRGTVVYRVNDLATNETLDLKPDDPLARLYFGEGWGALGGTKLVITRKEAKLFILVSALHSLKMAFDYAFTPLSSRSLAINVNGQSVFFESNVNNKESYEVIIPESVLHSGLNEVTFQFSGTAPVGSFMRELPFVTADTYAHYPIVVRSAGEEQGAFGHIYVSGVDESPNARGYNLVVIDSRSGAVYARANFDTFASEQDSARMAQFIAQIPSGKIVAVAARDEASFHLTPEAVDALKTIGAQQDLRGKFRWSHAIIGVKGASSGSALECASEIRVCQLVVGIGATEPNIAASIGEIRIEPAP